MKNFKVQLSFVRSPRPILLRDVQPGRIASLLRPSVRPSVCPLTRKQKKRQKTKLLWTFPLARISRLPIVTAKIQRSSLPDVKNLH